MSGKGCSSVARCCECSDSEVTMSRRLRSTIFILLFASVVLLFITGRTWISLTVTEAGFPQFQLSMTGRDIEPLIAGCAWALVTSSVALLVTRGFLQRFVACIALGLSAMSTVSCLQAHGSRTATSVNSFVATAVGRQIDGLSTHDNVLWLIATILSIVCAVAASIVFITGSTSKQLSSRYERHQDVSELSTWQALDQGIDPTVDPEK